MGRPEKAEKTLRSNACEETAARLAAWQKPAYKPANETRAAIAATPSGRDNITLQSGGSPRAANSNRFSSLLYRMM
jgi:hypothetical protein